MKFFATTIIAFFFVTEAAAFQVPPIPPPGGSELWSGTSIVTSTSTCLECSGWEFISICWRGVFDFVEIGFTEVECGSNTDPQSWGYFQLQDALNGTTPLPGGYVGLSAILEAIGDGNIYGLSDLEWGLLVSYASGSDLALACGYAEDEDSFPAACNDVPLPLWLNLLLLLSLIVFWKKVYLSKTILLKP